MGWGRARRGSLHLRLPLSRFPYLHPSLSFSVHLSLCLLPPLAVNFPHPHPHVCLLFLGRVPGLWALAPRYPCLRVEARIPGQTRKIPRGLGGDNGTGIGKVPKKSYDSQLPTILPIFPPSLEAPCLFPCCLAQVPKKHLGEVELVRSRPQVFPAQDILAVWVSLQPLSGHTPCYVNCCN